MWVSYHNTTLMRKTTGLEPVNRHYTNGRKVSQDSPKTTAEKFEEILTGKSAIEFLKSQIPK